MRRTPFIIVGLTLLSAVLLTGMPATSHPVEPGDGKDAPVAVDPNFPDSSEAPEASPQPCVNGMAGYFPCKNVNLASFLPMSEIGGGRGSDMWGWTDPQTERRYVIAARDTGTSFVDVTNSRKPMYLGNLPNSGTQDVIWHDVKVYADHAFIVSEGREHGMQVYDLRQLRDIDRAEAPVTFTETAHYTDFGRAHNLAINEDSGYAYAVGVREDQHSCASGLHMVDIRDPSAPVFAGCFADDGYTHDTECVIYDGPDTQHAGREICLNSNVDTLTIVDVTDKAAPVMLSSIGYEGSAYTHQGWLTEDSRHFLVGDELDELQFSHNTKTLIWDVSDLDAPRLVGKHTAETKAIDHNMYIKGNLLFQSNYLAGLRILRLDDVAEAKLTEVAYFDVWPQSDDTAFGGTWSNYPFFDNGIVAVHGFNGLFLVQP
ncbi:MAG: choice-of-anchor B family protein, partial [Micromonosporaceae bacterium]